MAVRFTWKNEYQNRDDGQAPRRLKSGVEDICYTEDKLYSQRHLVINLWRNHADNIEDTSSKIIDELRENIGAFDYHVNEDDQHSQSIHIRQMDRKDIMKMIGYLVENAWLNNDVQAGMVRDFGLLDEHDKHSRFR